MSNESDYKTLLTVEREKNKSLNTLLKVLVEIFAKDINMFNDLNNNNNNKNKIKDSLKILENTVQSSLIIAFISRYCVIIDTCIFNIDDESDDNKVLYYLTKLKNTHMINTLNSLKRSIDDDINSMKKSSNSSNQVFHDSFVTLASNYQTIISKFI